jgi:cytochrome c biogenesis factor
MEIRGYTLTYRKLVQHQSENAQEVRALVDVRRGGSSDGTLSAGKNHYPVEGQTSNEVAIRSNIVTGEDLYLIAQQIDPNGTVFFKAEVLPLVNLIWLAGFVFLGGTLIALWPDARESRRLADRYGYAAARA